jgi:phage terminase large subunit-like protein
VVLIPGRSADKVWIGQWLARETAGTELVTIGCDRWGLADLTAAWERDGLHNLVSRLSPVGQGFKDMTGLVAAFEALILDRKISHQANPVLRWAAANATITQDPAGNRKLDKSQARGRIDPVIAALMACGLSARAEAQPSFEYTGLLVL